MGGTDAGPAAVTISQHVHSSGIDSYSTISSSRALIKTEDATDDQFPAGLRVLVVDDDPICLLMLETLLRRCLYQVTTCAQAIKALSMLRENRDKFDLIISDVCMPDMDGFKLLELVGLEMDLPVIMMSANAETSAVMKGITHGACDYLLKPVRIEELKNIWQHVVRKKRKQLYEKKNFRSNMRGTEDTNNPSSPHDGVNGKPSRKRKDPNDDDEENDDDDNGQEHEDLTTAKKPRVVWSMELHQQFVNAVNQLGIDKAVPKRILELMSVQGLTRENVASHLQKYRLFLKRLSSVSNQQANTNFGFGNVHDSSFSSHSKACGLGELRTLFGMEQLSSHTLASLQGGVFNRLNNVGKGNISSSGPIQWLPFQGNSNTLARHQISTHFTNQGYPLHIPPSEFDMEKPPQPQKMVVMGHFGTQTNDADAFQEQLSMTGVNIAGHGGKIHEHMPWNSTDNSFQIRLLQLQNQMQEPSNLPTMGHLGNQTFSSETSFGYADKFSRAGDLIRCLHGGEKFSNLSAGGGVLTRENKVPLSSIINLPVSFTNTSILDSPNLATPVECSLMDPRNIGVSSPSLVSLIPQIMDDLTISNSRGTVRNPNDQFSEKALEIDSLRLPHPDLGFKQGIDQNLLRNGFLSPPVCIPHLTQICSGQRTIAPAVEKIATHWEAKNPKLNLPLTLDNHQAVVPPASAQCDSEQSTAESTIKVGKAQLVGGLGVDGRFLSETCLPADELISIFYRQHQGHGSLEGTDLTSEGYALQNLYVK